MNEMDGGANGGQFGDIHAIRLPTCRTARGEERAAARFPMDGGAPSNPWPDYFVAALTAMHPSPVHGAWRAKHLAPCIRRRLPVSPEMLSGDRRRPRGGAGHDRARARAFRRLSCRRLNRFPYGASTRQSIGELHWRDPRIGLSAVCAGVP
jgi:hypothetical protein